MKIQGQPVHFPYDELQVAGKTIPAESAVQKHRETTARKNRFRPLQQTMILLTPIFVYICIFSIINKKDAVQRY
jgi:hypothetical protein